MEQNKQKNMTLVFQNIIDVWMREKEGEIGREGKEREWGRRKGRIYETTLLHTGLAAQLERICDSQNKED